MRYHVVYTVSLAMGGMETGEFLLNAGNQVTTADLKEWRRIIKEEGVNSSEMKGSPVILYWQQIRGGGQVTKKEQKDVKKLRQLCRKVSREAYERMRDSGDPELETVAEVVAKANGWEGDGN